MKEKRRIWSELVPIGELSRNDAILRELAQRGVQLLAAVQPRDEDDAMALVTAARERGVSIGLWPLLDDKSGRWLHPGNASELADWIERLLSALDRRRLSIDALALDLEPPIDEVRRITEGHLGAARAWLTREVDASLHTRLVGELRERGIESVAAILPQLVASGACSRGWQRALGTPIDGVCYDVVTAMLYTTLFEGYSFGTIARSDARALLSRFAKLARERFGDRASVSLGAVGRGALGDEQTYRAPSELADDVALARAAGIADIALFDLSGILARPPHQRWLDALTEPASAPAPATPRARAALAGLWITGVLLDAAGRLKTSRLRS